MVDGRRGRTAWGWGRGKAGGGALQMGLRGHFWFPDTPLMISLAGFLSSPNLAPLLSMCSEAALPSNPRMSAFMGPRCAGFSKPGRGEGEWRGYFLNSSRRFLLVASLAYWGPLAGREVLAIAPGANRSLGSTFRNLAPITCSHRGGFRVNPRFPLYSRTSISGRFLSGILL